MKIILEIETTNREDLYDAGTLIDNLVKQNDKEAQGFTPTKPVETKTIKKDTKPKPTPKKDVEKPVEKTVTVTLAELKELAKVKVGATDRETVKDIISEFAPKLAEVKEADYLPLSEKLA